ncbi:acyl-CoA-binding domain-containing protein 4 isoform X2 [Tachyglossus aculeatus]|uniref:acyl-CoA-binding domain-containing protein 4 isoform X2 n=1 Tax=Tachyglossus aculeatus TaxID=9261 RepID=UPI0018F287FD|nr:acyl-CoA-binding domain-containing protein 4 isoform X2 [Tachyglossus aculeatus]
MGTESERPEPTCQQQFEAAVGVVQSLPKNGSYRPSYEEMLRFYSFYKQATVGPCPIPRPGFWDPIGRYKWDAWNSLGRMSKEAAMTAYISEMKRVAQKVIDTVPLDDVEEDTFGYFEPLYAVIPDMPRPPETFLRRISAQASGDLAVHTIAPSRPEGEVWGDPVEQPDRPEPEQSSAPRETPPGPSEGRGSPKPPEDRVQGSTRCWDSGPSAHFRDEKGAEHQEGPPGVDRPAEEARPGPESAAAERGPDLRLTGTVRALQDGMAEVQRRLRALERLPPAGQKRLSRPLRVSGRTLAFLVLWPFVAQWLFRRLRARMR